MQNYDSFYNTDHFGKINDILKLKKICLKLNFLTL